MSVLLAANEIVQRIVSLHKKNKKWDFNSIKSSVCKKYSVMPRLVDIISAIPPEYSDLVHLLRAKPVRTSSGVAIVAVMCKPHRCPHIALTGNICIYCPGGVDSDFEYSTQSYTGYEPTSMRAIRHRYDPFQQARTRLLQLQQLGHMPDKVEYIVMGGTFMSLPDSYKNNFIKDLHDALSGNSSSSLEEAIEFSEKSKLKCVGITIETRPDYCKKPHINRMLNYGCTRVEIGVQSIFEDVARDTNRGHSVKDVCNTFCAVKDSGYKIVSHMMPNLPNVDIVRDYMQFEEYFNSPSFRSDGLKIYPTLVMRGTGLYELWKNKKYKNYSPDVLVDFLARILALVPPWTRIYRVQRDIPMPLVSSGVEYGNIRELALAKMKDYGTKCRDIRTREVGMKKIHENVFPEKVELIRRDYAANNGWETFLSYEDIENDILVGMLRLRKCSTDTFREELKDMEEISEDSSYEEEEVDCCLKFDFGFKYNCMNEKCTCMNKDKNENTKKGKEVNKQNNEEEPFIKFSKCKQISYNASIIRELHVYGAAVPILHKDKVRYQHIGYGARLIEEAEQIAREEHGSKKIAIISGVGTRLYYKKFGYRLEGPYMVKDL